MTATAGYAMAPGVFSFHTAVCATIGTAMASAAANTINQILEVPFDSQMNRTKNRWDHFKTANLKCTCFLMALGLKEPPPKKKYCKQGNRNAKKK